MNEFISKFKDYLSGVLCGFDRLVVRGDLGLNHESGMKGYLWAKGLGLKDFGSHAEQLSRRVKQAALAPIEAAGRPVRYLNSGKHSKEEIARRIAAADRIACGPICALTAVELCRSYAIRGSRLDHKLHLERAWRKCLFVYQYWIHPVFGFMSTRLQTWFPFTLHLYLNGREWLARQMDEAELCYQRHDNCFLHIEDFARAQQLMDRQLETNWPQQLDQIVPEAHPLLSEISTDYPLSYYWTCAQSEWADDYALLEAVNRGEFTVNGLRNRDLQRLLHASPASSKTEARRRSAAVSRKLRLLRAHGILQKLPHTHRYQVTDAGRLILNGITSARRATIHRLTSIAA